MSRRIIHFCLILLLAIGPVQSAFAGISALQHARCDTSMQHDMSQHAGMQHDQQAKHAGGQCECKHCGSHCFAVGAAAAALPAMLRFIPEPGRTLLQGFRSATLIGQVPDTEIRPPITLQS